MTRQKAVEVLKELTKPGRLTILASVGVYDAIKIAVDALGKNEDVPSKTFTVIDTKTGKEADTYDIVWHEDWAKNLMYSEAEIFVIAQDGSLIIMDKVGNLSYCPEGRFEVRWEMG